MLSAVAVGLAVVGYSEVGGTASVALESTCNQVEHLHVPPDDQPQVGPQQPPDSDRGSCLFNVPWS